MTHDRTDIAPRRTWCAHCESWFDDVEYTIGTNEPGRCPSCNREPVR